MLYMSVTVSCDQKLLFKNNEYEKIFKQPT